MRYRRLVNFVIILIGGTLAVVGVLLLAIAAFGDVRQGQSGLALGGMGFLLAAAPALAAPFAARLAKLLPFLAMACLAAFAVRLTFWPQAGVSPTPLVKVAVVAFAVLLVLRVLLGQRSKNTGPGT